MGMVVARTSALATRRQRSRSRRVSRRIATTAVTGLASALVLAGLILLPSAPASAAVLTIDQCNAIGATVQGATTGITCTVNVVNTINGSTRGSVTTVTRTCSLGPCPSGNRSNSVSNSTSLVTQITQCNASGNDAAPPLITCRVTVTNRISAGTPSAEPVTAATVNQCVGTATGGGQYSGQSGPILCSPFPASTTGATVTQCNGSADGGGSTALCTVPSSTISPAIPIRVNQCNGTGRAGGTLLTCSTSISTEIVPAVVATPTPSASAATTPTPSAGATTPTQVTVIPPGGVETGGGSTVALRHTEKLTLGGLLVLFAGFILYRRRLVQEPLKLKRRV